VREGGPACPACGAATAVLLGSDPREPGWGAPAALLGAHALLCTAATLGHPGILLGHVWFAEGLGAALLATGTERLVRVARLVVGASVLVHLAYLVLTPQLLFTALGVGVLLALVVMMKADRSGRAVGMARGFAVVFTGLLVVGVLAAQYGYRPPGWWQGQHPIVRPIAVADPAAPR